MNDNDMPPLKPRRDGYTLVLTQPEPPTHVAQPYDAVVLEPFYPGDDWQELWLAAPDRMDPERPNAAKKDSRSALLSPADMRALAAELVARADAIDPPKAAYERAYESRRVMMDPSLTRNEPMFGTVRPDWASAEHPDKYAVLWDKYADEPVEHRAYHWAYTLFPVLEEDGGRHVFNTPLPDPGSEVAW